MTPRASNLKYAQNRANDLHDLLGSWDAVAEIIQPFLALSGASWWNVSKGERITSQRINALRAQEHLAPLPAEFLIEACPTCNGTHDLERIPDCHGLPINAVVTLASNERVTHKRQAPAPHTLSDYPVAVLAEMFQHRQPYQGDTP